MEKTILISFIGNNEYKKIKYKFLNNYYKTEFFSSILFNYFRPDLSIFLGTSTSRWDYLYNLKENELKSSYVYEKILSRIIENKQIDNNLLINWQRELNKVVNSEIFLKIYKDSLESFLNIFYDILKNYKNYKLRIILDITHTFRHIPLVVTLILSSLSFIFSIKDFKIFYGKIFNTFDGSQNYGETIELHYVNDLIKFLSAISLMKNSLDPSGFSNLFEDEYFKKLHLKLETNRKLGRKFKTDFSLKLKEISNSLFGKIIQNILLSDIKPLIEEDYLCKRMLKRALEFAKRNQFMKAYTLVYEAILTAYINMHNKKNPTNTLNIDKVKDRIKVSKLIVKYLEKKDKDIAEKYRKIKTIRNAIVHGSNPLKVPPHYLEDEKILKDLILSAKKIIDYITTQIK